jgi:excisionase family DNA binding protein
MITDLATHIENLEGALTAKQISKFTGISGKTIYEYAADGRLPSYRIGSMLRFDPCHVATWWRGKKQ